MKNDEDDIKANSKLHLGLDALLSLYCNIHVFLALNLVVTILLACMGDV